MVDPSQSHILRIRLLREHKPRSHQSASYADPKGWVDGTHLHLRLLQRLNLDEPLVLVHARSGHPMAIRIVGDSGCVVIDNVSAVGGGSRGLGSRPLALASFNVSNAHGLVGDVGAAGVRWGVRRDGVAV